MLCGWLTFVRRGILPGLDVACGGWGSWLVSCSAWGWELWCFLGAGVEVYWRRVLWHVCAGYCGACANGHCGVCGAQGIVVLAAWAFVVWEWQLLRCGGSIGFGGLG